MNINNIYLITIGLYNTWHHVMCLQNRFLKTLIQSGNNIIDVAKNQKLQSG